MTAAVAPAGPEAAPYEKLLGIVASAWDNVKVVPMDEDLADRMSRADVAALVAYGESIVMHPGLERDLGADVLAMAMAVVMKMTNRPGGEPGEIIAPQGWVIISSHRLPFDPSDVVGRMATVLARGVGRDVESASLEWALGEFGEDGNGTLTLAEPASGAAP
jgi:hypothetical protein